AASAADLISEVGGQVWDVPSGYLVRLGDVRRQPRDQLPDTTQVRLGRAVGEIAGPKLVGELVEPGGQVGHGGCSSFVDWDRCATPRRRGGDLAAAQYSQVEGRLQPAYPILYSRRRIDESSS